MYAVTSPRRSSSRTALTDIRYYHHKSTSGPLPDPKQRAMMRLPAPQQPTTMRPPSPMLSTWSWLTSPPPADLAVFSSPLGQLETLLATKLAAALSCCHSICCVQLKSDIVQWRGGLGFVADLTPEILSNYGELTGRKTKGVVIFDGRIQAMTPRREGNIRIKGPGESVKLPHLAIIDRNEEEKFLSFGSASLAIVVKPAGILDGEEKTIIDLARAIKKRRVERLLVVTDGKSTQTDWEKTRRICDEHEISVGYREVGINNLYKTHWYSR